jgi:hypothetical protein
MRSYESALDTLVSNAGDGSKRVGTHLFSYRVANSVAWVAGGTMSSW